MTTVLAVYNSAGCVGRCDAKCHNATAGDCDCICGGRNHGGGTQRAIENTQRLIDPTGDMRRRFAEAHGYVADELKIEIEQQRLVRMTGGYGKDLVSCPTPYCGSGQVRCAQPKKLAPSSSSTVRRSWPITIHGRSGSCSVTVNENSGMNACSQTGSRAQGAKAA